MHPPNPIICTSLIAHPVFEVPIIPGVSEAIKGVVCGDCISTPTRDSNAEMLDVACGSGEVDAIDQGINGGADCLDDAKWDIEVAIRIRIRPRRYQWMHTFHIEQPEGHRRKSCFQTR